VLKDDARVELYINHIAGVTENEAIFDALAAERGAIEAAFGGSLDRQRRDNATISKIQRYVGECGYADESKWATVQEALIEAMVRLEKAFRPHISKLQH
jgi:hypothetical protein